MIVFPKSIDGLARKENRILLYVKNAMVPVYNNQKVLKQSCFCNEPGDKENHDFQETMLSENLSALICTRCGYELRYCYYEKNPKKSFPML